MEAYDQPVYQISFCRRKKYRIKILKCKVHAQNNNIFALEKKKNINFKQKKYENIKTDGSRFSHPKREPKHKWWYFKRIIKYK